MSLRLTGTVGAVQDRALHGPRIIGWAKGCPVWSIVGAEGEGDGGDGSGSGDGNNGGQGGTGDGSGSGDGGGTGSEGQGGTGKEGDGKGDDKGGSTGTVSREEFDRLMARMQAADRNKSEVEKKLREYEDKDKSDLEKAQRDLKEVTETVATKDAVIKTQAVKLAFMTSAAHITWHDPADALEFAMKELSDLEVKEDGTVDAKAVKAAADKLAKDKPYLVKANTSGGSGGGTGGGSNGGNGASGASVGGGGKNDGKGADKDRLIGKYPALRR